MQMYKIKSYVMSYNKENEMVLPALGSELHVQTFFFFKIRNWPRSVAGSRERKIKNTTYIIPHKCYLTG